MRLGLAILISLQGCGSAPQQAQAIASDSTTRASAELAVHIAAIKAIVASDHPSVVLVVASRAQWTSDPSAGGAWGLIWQDFLAHARASGPLEVLALDIPFQVVSGGHLLGQEVTDTVIIALSSVGFSPSGDEAMVYVDVRCGTHCGVGSIQTFRRDGSVWVHVKSDTTSRR